MTFHSTKSSRRWYRAGARAGASASGVEPSEAAAARNFSIAATISAEQILRPGIHGALEDVDLPAETATDEAGESRLAEARLPDQPRIQRQFHIGEADPGALELEDVFVVVDPRGVVGIGGRKGELDAVDAADSRHRMYPLAR